MLSSDIKERIFNLDKLVDIQRGSFKMPKYNPVDHCFDLGRSKYFYALLILRHCIKSATDYYFTSHVGAINVDLFMLTPSVSSPMGPGSDSEAIKIKFGKHETCLVDSSQFGFEPILLNGFEKLYCYLPSMRGEDPDSRHLNQFYHCEMEMKGGIDEIVPIIESYVKTLCEVILSMESVVKKISVDSQKTINAMALIIDEKKFPVVNFDDAVDVLVKNGCENLVNFTEHGRDISAEGELKLMNILGIKTPLWVKNYDRDRVPFYQKPSPGNFGKVINADLLFPPLLQGSFGGEIVGCGQRQDNAEEMRESLRRQGYTNPKEYEWYMKLRKFGYYDKTSGFGLGIERFIAWSLAHDNIRDVIPYPRIKNIVTYP